MTLVEFHEKLYKIDFEHGVNIEPLEKYLLACLYQLNLHKSEKPSHELFLLMFDQARNGICETFDPSWKEIEQPWGQTDLSEQTQWYKTRDYFRRLAADLIHTREVRSRPGFVERDEWPGEWTTESGLRFYNGTTPGDILKYTADRIESEYPSSAYQEAAVSWIDFCGAIEFGIKYE